MLHGLKIVVVMPAYHAEKTLAECHAAIPHDIVDEVLLVDDASDDATVAVAQRLGIRTHRHAVNRGYGGNQKTCYALALGVDADIVVMLHPDYQYEPRLITAMAAMIASGVYDVVFGSRILGNTAIAGGMPRYKYVFNRMLTAFENLVIGSKLSEFHSGYRAFSRKVLETLPLAVNSDDFVFDNQMLVQAHAFGWRIGEMSCPTKYFADASEINFRRSVVYGLGVLRVAVTYRLWKWRLLKSRLFCAAPENRLTAMQADAP
ncbi:MAG: glycosyltransferase family 2 protein [Dokdonella sp.]|uniref:glycosyltransferase family 2 protein n=1 Tax=Dokdonella sp. TaxID=2291710 RepID=UPI0025C35199|nr:glycosyltransferase family 2 protein [Dokdonella sp.]MBZ0222089.1 glycosyltransferase family 2 protein [Dokdonella sp.]